MFGAEVGSGAKDCCVQEPMTLGLCRRLPGSCTRQERQTDRSSRDGFWAQSWSTNTRHWRIHPFCSRRRNWGSILSLASSSFSMQCASLFFDASTQLECLRGRMFFSIFSLWSFSESDTHQQEAPAKVETQSYT